MPLRTIGGEPSPDSSSITSLNTLDTAFPVTSKFTKSYKKFKSTDQDLSYAILIYFEKIAFPL
jgi:hypothetical protein